MTDMTPSSEFYEDDEPVEKIVEAFERVEVGRPPGATHGSPIDASFALNVQPMPLPPGRYEWLLEFADRIFSASFEVRRGT